MTRRLQASAVVLGLVVTALFWIDPLFIPLALVGPLVVGIVAAWKRLPVMWVVVVWLVAGLGAVVSDFVVNQEDVIFHVVLTAFVVGLGAGTWWLAARLIGSRRPATP
jgi:hypothetical protein